MDGLANKSQIFSPNWNEFFFMVWEMGSYNLFFFLNQRNLLKYTQLNSTPGAELYTFPFYVFLLFWRVKCISHFIVHSIKNPFPFVSNQHVSSLRPPVRPETGVSWFNCRCSAESGGIASQKFDNWVEAPRRSCTHFHIKPFPVQWKHLANLTISSLNLYLVCSQDNKVHWLK